MAVMQMVNITEAKAHLSSILKTVESSNHDVIIKRGTHPIAKLVKLDQPPKKNMRLGALKGQIKISDDFDEWSDDYAKAFGMKG